MSTETRTDMHAAYIHTASPPPMAPYTLPPSLLHSLKRREPVKDARRQHADRVAVQVEEPGHETRRQSALTHSTSTCPLCPSACTCMCPMHMHVCAPWLCLSLWICAHRACVCACACASSHVTNIQGVGLVCVCVCVCVCMCECVCVYPQTHTHT